MSNKIEFTDSAKKEIQRVVSQKSSKTYFRISVQGGGCSGFKYNFSFDDKIKTDDNIFDKTLIDKNSLKIIEGSVVDFKKELIGNYGIKRYEVNASGKRISQIDYLRENQGDEVKITIDLEVQKTAQSLLKNKA